MLKYLFFFFIGIISRIQYWFAEWSALDQDPNIRDITLGDKWGSNPFLETLKNNLSWYFILVDNPGWGAVNDLFMAIAFNIKNLFIAIAVIFLIIGVIKLLFSSGGDEDVKKWKSNIIWVSIGVVVMQMAFSIWHTLVIRDPSTPIWSALWWEMWTSIIRPLIGIIYMLASFGFIAMMFYAFYTIVTGWGDEEKLKKGKSTVIYAGIGYLLIRLPEAIVRAIYGSPSCKTVGLFEVGNCEIKNHDLGESLKIIGTIFNYFNTFLTIICVFLVIYAGWLVFISGGDEEKLKKAKHIVLYIIIGLLILVSSHAIFQFFILKG
jgi:Type IV secretion system pilin